MSISSCLQKSRAYKEGSGLTNAELVYFLYFIVLFGSRSIGIYEGNEIYKYMLILGMLLFFLKICITEHTLLEHIIIAALIGTAGIVYFESGEKGLLLYFTLMLGIKGVSTRKVFRLGTTFLSLSLVVLILLSLSRIIDDVCYLQDRPGIGSFFRRSLGYPHPNTLHTTYVILTMFILYLFGHRNMRRLYACSIVLSFISLWLFLYSGSRTGLVISFGYILINLLLAQHGKLSSIIKWSSLFVYPITCLITIIFPMLSETVFGESIDRHLRSRFVIARYYLENNGISVFGQRLYNPDAKYYGIDFSSLSLLLQDGLVAFAIISMLWMCMTYRLIKDDRRAELAIVITLLIMGVTDPFLYNLSFKNIAFIFMGEWLYTTIGRIQVSMPEWMNREYRLLKLKKNTLSVPISIIIQDRVRKTISQVRGKELRLAITWATAATVIGLTSFLLSQEPAAVYSNRNTSEASYSILPVAEQHFSPNQINDLHKEGNIVIGYHDEATPMYVYYGDWQKDEIDGMYTPFALKMEHFRTSVSLGVFLSAVLIILFVVSRNDGDSAGFIRKDRRETINDLA